MSSTQMKILQTCAAGASIFDCGYSKIPSSATECAAYLDKYVAPGDNILWVLVVGSIVAAAMCMGIGANDSANSWGTSVGSGAIKLKHALMLGGFMEFLGATTLGYGVSKTIGTGVSKITDSQCFACGYCDSSMSVYAVGMLGALFGAAIFLALASMTALPVSTTHAIVGGVIGMTMTLAAPSCLNWEWKGLSGVIASWVISPLLSGFICVFVYLLTRKLIILAENPRQRAITLLPIMYAACASITIALICLKSKPTKGWEKSTVGIVSVASGVLAILVAKFFVVPKSVVNLDIFDKEHQMQQMKKLEGGNDSAVTQSELNSTLNATVKKITQTGEKNIVMTPCVSCLSASCVSCVGTESANQDDVPEEESQLVDKICVNEHVLEHVHDHKVAVPEHIRQAYIAENQLQHKSAGVRDAIWLFQHPLVFIAALEAFAHGANDTANATGAMTAIYHTYSNGLSSCDNESTPVWIMAIAGLFVWFGVVMFGSRVIKTIGSDITVIDYHQGFCIELASTLTVIIATVLEFPVSTTHCQVGAVIFCGMASVGTKGVDWALFRKIGLSWAFTLPIAGLTSIFFASAFKGFIA